MSIITSTKVAEFSLIDMGAKPVAVSPKAKRHVTDALQNAAKLIIRAGKSSVAIPDRSDNVLSRSVYMNTEVNQMEWHKKPLGWKVCPHCGCENIRAGVEHRAISASEGWKSGTLWVKRISVCFGTDHSIEPICLI